MLELNQYEVGVVSGGLFPAYSIARFIGQEAAAWGLDQAFDYERDHIGRQAQDLGRYQMSTGRAMGLRLLELFVRKAC